MDLKGRILKKSNLWHLGAIALFLIVSCVYFSPALKGYTLKQPDIVNYIGMSREVQDFRDNDGEQALWTNAMFSGMPSTQISMRYENTWLARGGRNLIRLGLPTPIFFLFVYFIGFYVLALSLKIKPLIGIIGSLAFGLSSYFIIILEAGHNSKASAIGMATFMLAGFIMAYRWKNWILGVGLSALFMTIELYINHLQITYYMGFILLLIGIAELLRHIKEGQLVKFGKVTGLLVLGYIFAVMVNYGNIFGTAEYAKQTIRGGTELTIDATGASTEGIKTSGLDREYITNWSYGKAETFSLFVPNFKGGESQIIAQDDANKDLLKEVDQRFRQNVAESNQYWGDQPFTSGPVYIGIIVLFLAFLALVYVKNNYKWALLSAALLAIMLSWGKNYVSGIILLPIILYNVNMFLDNKKQLIFTAVNTLLFFLLMTSGDAIMERSLTDFFLDALPGYNKFRAVTIVLVVVELCVPFLGILFLQQLFKERETIKNNMNGFYIVSGAFLLFLLILAGAPGMFNTFLSAQETAVLDTITDPNLISQYSSFFDELEGVRQSIFSKDVGRSLLLFILSAGFIFAFLKFTFSQIVLGAGLGLLIFIDVYGVASRYVNTEGRGKRYNQWIELYNYNYPYVAGYAEKAILKAESIQNPDIPVKIDSALAVLEQQFKNEDDVSNREKQLRRDYTTFRVLNRNSNFRVLEGGNPFNSSYASYFNKSIGGYHGAKLSRYQDLIEFHWTSGQNPSVMNMLNAKYSIQPQRDNTGSIVNSQLISVNREAMGNAWFTKDVKIVADANEEITSMNSYEETTILNKSAGQVLVDGEPIVSKKIRGTEAISVLLPGMEAPAPIENIPYTAVKESALAMVLDSTGINWVYDSAPDSAFNKIFSLSSEGPGGWDAAQTTIVDQRYSENISKESYSGVGTIEMSNYHPDRISYISNSDQAQFAVFSEIYYEGGWKAYIDGEEQEISRVNYVLRGLEVPAGEHTIEFKFELKSYETASTMALVGSLLILILIIAGICIEVKSGNTEETEIDDEVLNTPIEVEG